MGASPVMPENRLSVTPQRSSLVFAYPQPSLTESLHIGGVALNDPSQGLRVQTWTCTTDGSGVFIRGETVPQTTLFTGTGITEVSLAFDRNMNPFVAFVEGGVARYWWFNTAIGQRITSTLPAGSITPRAVLDDVRESQSEFADIILAYVRDGQLMYRQQRDSYTIERVLAASGVSGLNSVAMGSNLRLQFDVVSDAGGASPWTVGDALTAIAGDAGLSAAQVAMGRELFAQNLEGFASTPASPAAEHLRVLSRVFFFDAQDADGRLRFLPRGAAFDAVITDDEFVEGEDEPESDTTRDTISVPRIMHLMYFDVNGGQAADKQQSEREFSPRVEAPVVVETPVVLTAEQAVRALAVQHKVMEEEVRGELSFGISDRHIRLAEADVIVVQYRGRSQRCRVTRVELLDGWQRITAVRDRQSAYTSTVQPVPPAVVTAPPSTIPGPTRFAFLDLPALSQAGDVLGYQLATSGELASWRGAIIEREEAGAQFALLTTDGTGTVMGTLTAPLGLASEHYSDETNVLTVQLARSDDDLSTITRAVWLSRGNAAALVRADGTAEIVQFREAVETTPGTWELRGLLRGRLNSGASAHAVGATFVLLEAALLVQAPSERLATTLTHRAYSFGNDPTTAVSQARTWTGRSQREWPPIITAASRAADTLTVSWIARHRFGSDENPVASSHFDGWRIEASSGGTTVGLDATPLTASAALNVAGLANPITVTVRGRNRLAGLGDAATRIVP